MTYSVQSDLAIPRILFGTERQVQRSWRKLVRQAWKTKQWSFDLEMVPIEQIKALIVSSSPLLRSSHPESWRMYVVGEAFQDLSFKYMSPGPAGMDEFDALLLDGMKRLWFTIGLLQVGNGRFNLSHFPRTRPITQVLYDYVDRFAYWLPELVVLERLFYNDMFLVGGPPCDWAFAVLCLASDCDVTLPMTVDAGGQNLIDALLEARLIEPFNSRYRARRIVSC